MLVRRVPGTCEVVTAPLAATSRAVGETNLLGSRGSGTYSKRSTFLFEGGISGEGESPTFQKRKTVSRTRAALHGGGITVRVTGCEDGSTKIIRTLDFSLAF